MDKKHDDEVETEDKTNPFRVIYPVAAFKRKKWAQEGSTEKWRNRWRTLCRALKRWKQ